MKLTTRTERMAVCGSVHSHALAYPALGALAPSLSRSLPIAVGGPKPVISLRPMGRRRRVDRSLPSQAEVSWWWEGKWIQPRPRPWLQPSTPLSLLPLMGYQRKEGRSSRDENGDRVNDLAQARKKSRER